MDMTKSNVAVLAEGKSAMLVKFCKRFTLLRGENKYQRGSDVGT